MDHADEILDMLRSEQDLDLLSIESQHIDDMERFVFDLYACDTVPLEHLRAKLRYLFQVPPEILVVFVKNHAPEEMLVGEGAFRKVQCQHINRIKWAIREKFNPRINGIRSEEHVVHASDYEEQVDYVLKLLGHPEGIRYLNDGSDGLPFRKPFHIPKPGAYTFRRLKIDSLRASILREDIAHRVYAQATPICQTPHYRALVEQSDIYVEYLRRFRYTYLKDDYSWRRLYELSRLSPDEVKRLDPILVTAADEGFQILDGVHRAATALFHHIEAISCIVISY